MGILLIVSIAFNIYFMLEIGKLLHRVYLLLELVKSLVSNIKGKDYDITKDELMKVIEDMREL